MRSLDNREVGQHHTGPGRRHETDHGLTLLPTLLLLYPGNLLPVLKRSGRTTPGIYTYAHRWGRRTVILLVHVRFFPLSPSFLFFFPWSLSSRDSTTEILARSHLPNLKIDYLCLIYHWPSSFRFLYRRFPVGGFLG